MTNITWDVSSGGQIRISFGTAYNQETLSQCMLDLAPLIQASLDADSRLLALDKHTPVNRFKAIAGIKAKYEYHMGQALALMTGLTRVACGEAVAEEFGFPEFGDDAEEGQYD